ncbi:hypothetical protein OV090_44110 [Nannocystis sp. RBIL2]|uniref:hypothetical protein n=1 Tax=Nannocystis sp. RBIL2 TaxID=2996788 RepID=UPI002270F88A|nr:hypothetical protein [Nannocystis sp. RBIL2]MCY1071811.1 hypothetical protein [Nannocystis sp. RBIL2]
MKFDLLGTLLVGASPPAAGGERHQVLFQPSFHSESLLTVELLPDATTVHLRVFTDSLWGALAGNADLRDARSPAELAELVALVLPPHSDHSAVLGSESVAQLRHDLARDLPGLSVPDDRRGCDGIGLRVAVTTADAPPARFEAWSPDAGLPAHAYFATLHRLATEVLDDPARTALEQLHGYLDLGPPLRDRGGSPRRLQIFSRLSSSEERVLGDFFFSAGDDEPVVVDMRNFEGMGTMLYPLFRWFSERPGPTLWVASKFARRQLREAGIPDAQLHHELADALLHLATLAASPSSRNPPTARRPRPAAQSPATRRGR